MPLYAYLLYNCDKGPLLHTYVKGKQELRVCIILIQQQCKQQQCKHTSFFKEMFLHLYKQIACYALPYSDMWASIATSKKDTQNTDSMQNLKVVIVGDGVVRKSCFLIQWSIATPVPSRFEEWRSDTRHYVPTVFDNYIWQQHHEGWEASVLCPIRNMSVWG